MLKHNGKPDVVEQGQHNNGSLPLMLTLIALSAALMQQTPAPAAPPELHTRFMIVGADGPGALDKDGDGYVSREEFSAPMSDLFARMDANGDGRLSTEELAAGHGAMGEGGDHNIMIMRGPGGRGGPGTHRIEVRREVSGGDGEGRTMVFSSGEPDAGGERRIVIRRMGGPGGESDLDTDNDGRISEAEFIAPLREAFARMDADRSGFIEEGERGPGQGAEVFVHRIETRQNGED